MIIKWQIIKALEEAKKTSESSLIYSSGEATEVQFILLPLYPLVLNFRDSEVKRVDFAD